MTPPCQTQQLSKGKMTSDNFAMVTALHRTPTMAHQALPGSMSYPKTWFCQSILCNFSRRPSLPQGGLIKSPTKVSDVCTLPNPNSSADARFRSPPPPVPTNKPITVFRSSSEACHGTSIPPPRTLHVPHIPPCIFLLAQLF